MGVKELIENNTTVYFLFNNIYRPSAWILNKITNNAVERLRFYNKQKYKLHLKKPRTFSEKVVWKKAYDRNPLLPITSDKYTVREHIIRKLGKKEGESVLIPLIYSTKIPETIPFEKLPKNFIVKANHGSGTNLIVRDGQYNKKDVIRTCKTWLKSSYGMDKLEWAYEKVNRKILIEKLLTDKNGDVPKDFKCYVFHGTCKYIHVDTNRFKKDQCRSIYDRNWNRVNGEIKFSEGPDIEKPRNLDRILQIAEKLGEDFDFVRVDFYVLGNKIYFGELTHYPGSGTVNIRPKSFDHELGKHWKIEREYWKR